MNRGVLTGLLVLACLVTAVRAPAAPPGTGARPGAQEVSPAEGPLGPRLAARGGDASAGAVRRLQPGRILRGRLGPESSLVRGGYREAFDLAVPAGIRLSVEMTSTQIDCRLVVVAPDGTEYSDEHAGAVSTARVRVEAASGGVYRIYAAGIHGREVGRFYLTATTEYRAPEGEARPPGRAPGRGVR